MSFEAELGFSNRVIARNNMGRFLSRLELAGARTMEDIADEGVKLSRGLAPTRTDGREDRRTRSLQESFFTIVTPNSAQWGNSARHAMPQETGSVPHPITGNVTFWWVNEDRLWTPGKNTIDHPGNPSRPYLRPAYVQVMSRYMEIARRHYR